MGEDVEKLKHRLPLLDYLRQQNWVARPAGRGPEFVGLCPLHPETRPSFYVNARKNLFYCHGCGQGGDLIRFVQLSRHLSFCQSLAYLEQKSTPPTDPAAVLEKTAAFYQLQLDRYSEARRYLEQRGLRDPALIKELRIGYAPGGSLRRHLATQGYSCDLLQRLGLLNPQGCDAFYLRVVFPGIVPHQLRHTYATEMLRAGVGLVAVMKLLGHTSPEMTMEYLDVTLNDLERAFELARSKPRHLVPQPKTINQTIEAISGSKRSLLAAQHVLEMFRRTLPNGTSRRRLDRLSNRLTKIVTEARKLATP